VIPAADFMRRQLEAWSYLPVDDVGYIPADELLALDDGQLRNVAASMAATRYGGWRNHGGLWRDLMGLDELSGLDVLDFGCGTGVESAELAHAGNRMGLADISPANLELAARLLHLSGYRGPLTLHLVQAEPPYLDAADASYDVFYASGVLHHIPWARQIMERAHALLRPGGQCRLLLYSDEGWRVATGTEPPEDVTADPSFLQFVRFFDGVGEYSDWYSAERLEQRFGDLFAVERCEYVTSDRRFLAAVLRRKDPQDES
jgi:SAM-dependent methyltransferase